MSCMESVINHKLRIEFDMTMMEYCIVQAVEKMNEKNAVKWFVLDVSVFTREFGFSKASVYNAFVSLQEKGLLEKNKKNDKQYRTTYLYEKFFK